MNGEARTGEIDDLLRGVRPGKSTIANLSGNLIGFADRPEDVNNYTLPFEEQRKLARRLSALNQIASTITSGIDLEQVISNILNSAAEVTGLDLCNIVILSEDGDQLIGKFSNLLSKEDLEHIVLNVEDSISGAAVKEQKVIALPDFPRQVHSPIGEKWGIKSTLLLPLRFKDKILGILYLSDLHREHEFSQDEIDVARAFADYAAIAVENARLFAGLQTSEQKYRELVENANDIIFSIDSTGRFTFYNSRFEQVLGYSSDELLDCPFTDIVAPKSVETSRESFRRALKGWIPGDSYELDLVTKTGQLVNAELSINTVYKEGTLASRQGIIRDISEKKKMFLENRRHIRELSALNAIAATVSQSLDLDEILNNTLDKVLEVMGIEAGSIYILDDTERVVRLVTWRGLEPQMVERQKEKHLSEGFAGTVTLTGEPIVAEDLTRDLRHQSSYVVKQGFRSLASLPITSKNKNWGALQLVSRRPRQFTEENVQLLTAIARQIGVAIENATLHDETVRMQKERISILKERLAQITHAQDQERRRLARELHDEMAQTLINLIVEMELSKSQHGDPWGGFQEIERYQRTLRDLLESTRRMLSDLRMISLTTIGLKAALDEDLLPRYRRESSCSVRCDYHNWPEDLPQDVSFNLYRIIQESLLNAKKHSHATEIHLNLKVEGRRLEVTVSDNGVGFDSDASGPLSSSGSHLGLIGNRERAALLGGEFIVTSGTGKGTIVRISVPIVWAGKQWTTASGISD